MLKKDKADIEAERMLKIEMDNAKRQRIVDITLISVCCAFILILGILIFIKPQQSFSEEENRSLVTFPQFSIDDILDGSFTGDIGKFYSDQFPFRDALVGVKGMTELALLKQENNGVILASDGHLVKRLEYTADDEVQLKKNLEYISSFVSKMNENGIACTVAIAPRSIDIVRNKLPDNFAFDRADAIWSVIDDCELDVVRFEQELLSAANNNEYVWFKTDHHWTARGAYIAYEKLSVLLGYEAMKNNFQYETVSTSFLGTTYSSSGMKWALPDTIELMRYDGDTDFTVINKTGNSSLEGLYDFSYLSTKDQYSVFIGGVNGHVSVIQTADNSTRRPKMLLIKDSFAHSIVPFLANHYDIEVIDLRYYRDSLSKYINENSFDSILILYGLDTLVTDDNVRRFTYGLN